MRHYERVSDISLDTIHDLRFVLNDAKWKLVANGETNFSTWHGVIDRIEHIDGLNHLWGRSRWHQAFFLSIPPTGKVHKHKDTAERYKTFHIPVLTNRGAVSVMYDPGPYNYHLDVGGAYFIDRTIEHESFNLGNTDRVHLLMEVND